MPPLSNPRHERFAQQLALGETSTQAFINAGYSKNGAHGHASRLVATGSVRARVTELQARIALRIEVTAARLLQDLIEEHYADIAEITNPNGTLKPIEVWPAHWRRMVQQYETPELSERSKDGGKDSWDVIGRMIKVRFKDRNRTDDLLARSRVFDMLVSASGSAKEIAGEVMSEIDKRIAEGRQRAARRLDGETPESK